MQNEEWIVKGRVLVWLAVAGFIIDRVLKWYAQNLPEGKVFSFAPGFEFDHFINPSLFFLPAWRWIPWLALIVLITILGFWILDLFRNWKLEIRNSSHQALLPILLGGMSNVFDRFAYGGVIDYVNILGVATINLADILILGGLFLLIFKPKTL